MSTDKSVPAQRDEQASREHHADEHPDPETFALQLAERPDGKPPKWSPSFSANGVRRYRPMTDRKIDGRTKRALDMAIAKRQVSQESYRAALSGEITLQQAKELGRDRGPYDTGQGQSGREDATKTPGKGRTPRYCLCGCGGMTRGGRFLPGHDHRLYGELKRQLRSDPLLRSDKFTDEQRRYAVERGLAGPEVLPEEERDG